MEFQTDMPLAYEHYMFLQFQVYAFHVEEACGQAPEDYLHDDERQRAPTFRMEHHLEQRLGRIHLKGRFLLGYLLS
jgi:hypothetical protein